MVGGLAGDDATGFIFAVSRVYDSLAVESIKLDLTHIPRTFLKVISRRCVSAVCQRCACVRGWGGERRKWPSDDVTQRGISRARSKEEDKNKTR